MATTPAAKPRGAAAPTKAAAAQTPADDTQTKGVSRREFLNYIWGASMALLLAQTGGAIIWFMLPRFRAGEFGGVFSIDPVTVPQKGSAPVLNAAGKFWLVNTNDGLLALSQVCTHLGCLYKWVTATNRFECPCHGSKYQADGTKIEGPTQRDLDRYLIKINGGQTQTDAEGKPVKTDGATVVEIDTGKKIKGAPSSV